MMKSAERGEKGISYNQPIVFREERLPWTLRVSQHALVRAQRRFDASIQHRSLVRSAIESLYHRLIIPCAVVPNQWWVPIQPLNEDSCHVLMWACVKLDDPLVPDTEYHLTVSTIFDDQYVELRETLKDAALHPHPAQALLENKERIKRGEVQPLDVIRKDISKRYGSKDLGKGARAKAMPSMMSGGELPARTSEVLTSKSRLKSSILEKEMQGYRVSRILISYERE